MAPRAGRCAAELPRAGRRAGRVPHRDRLHPRRAAARRRTPFRRLVGLPGQLVLRAVVALRHPRRLPLVRRPPAPRGHRRDRRLGARALPQGLVGAGALRRHPLLRARRPAPRRAARLGHARVRLRALPGAQLPRRQRAVLARRVPHRRPACRRRRLDALPGLLAHRVDAQPLRRPGEPRGGVVPPGGQRHRLQEPPQCGDHRRGVDGVARRHAADAPRRPGFRVQVEHGLDARHARLHRARSHVPGLPPQPDDVLDDVRVQRELRAAAVARRGRARQGLAVDPPAGRRRAQGRGRAGPVRLHVGAPGQAADLHGRRVRAGPRVVRGAVAGLGAARRPAPRRAAPAGRRPQRRLPLAARDVAAGLRPGRLLMDRRQRRGRQRPVVPAPRPRRERRRVPGQLRRCRPPELPRRAAGHRPVARGRQHRRRGLRRARRRQLRRGHRHLDPLARPSGLGRGDPAGVGGAVAASRRRGRPPRCRSGCWCGCCGTRRAPLLVRA